MNRLSRPSMLTLMWVVLQYLGEIVGGKLAPLVGVECCSVVPSPSLCHGCSPFSLSCYFKTATPLMPLSSFSRPALSKTPLSFNFRENAGSARLREPQKLHPC
jgi:hypothetical protein